uniref:Uncharacterized protein n=1 Tax=Romanomermis culicivorax TaxID=13658 RepID=A0A915JG39_ROMCU
MLGEQIFCARGSARRANIRAASMLADRARRAKSRNINYKEFSIAISRLASKQQIVKQGRMKISRCIDEIS